MAAGQGPGNRCKVGIRVLGFRAWGLGLGV